MALNFPSNNLIQDILYFPIWWYSQGLKNFLKWIYKQLKSVNYILGFKILVLNLFKPFYGDCSISGRLISLPLRMIWFCGIFIFMLLFFCLFLFLFLVWLLWLPFLIWAIVFIA